MIIALTGPAGCGKSTIARVLERDHGFVRVRFAGPLKSMLRALGLTAEQVDGCEKETPSDLLCGRTPRWAMQSLGTEWGRDLIGADLWVNATMRAVTDLVAARRDVVIDDLRFDNEARSLARFDACMLAVRRGVDVPTAVVAHVSEQGVSNTWLVGHVDNNGAIEDAVRQAINFAEARRMQGKHDL